MWVDPEFREALTAHGLDTCEQVMRTSAGWRLRAVASRENWRLELFGPDGQTQGVYLKKHRVWNLGTWLRAKLGWGPGRTDGRTEAANAVLLQQGGVATLKIVACGERLAPGGWLKSFVMTEELAGYTQLDHFLRKRFPAPIVRARTIDDVHLGRLLANVAAVARRFHELGFNHRDLYSCHFFIRETTPGEFDVRLIDLQRMQFRRRFRRRWLVKDLAQLLYSVAPDRIRCSQKMAFLKTYLGVSRLRPQDKALVRQILAKERSMQRRLGSN